MCKSCLIFDGKPTHDQVKAWFLADGKDHPPLKLTIDGSLLADEFLRESFHSELVIAKLLKNILEKESQLPGISIDNLDTTSDLPLAFLEMVKQEKEQSACKVIMLHETGSAALASNEVDSITSYTHFQEEITVIIGNHNGFPATIENELLRLCDQVLCLSTRTPLPGIKIMSYLGSHVIDMLHYFFS